jgi:UDP-N-acetylglucosamine--N-acetylmuramyl-(pentapeptide) pyrophosphoryl-undecaprenol N-acetylglucosamine transferase
VRQASADLATSSRRPSSASAAIPTLPPLYAATRRGLPTLLHEQNAVMGRANKALAGRVTRSLAASCRKAAGAHAAKTVVTGNPVRPAVLEAAETPYRRQARGDPFRLLVFGGSQGAQFFSEAVPPAIAACRAWRRRLHRDPAGAQAEDLDGRARGLCQRSA